MLLSLKAIAPTLVIAGLLVVFRGEVFSAHESGGELLPNLKTLDPANFSVSNSGGNGNRPPWAGGGGGNSEQRLLFDNEVWNAHAGVLELVPTSDKCTTGKGADGRIALQRVYVDANGDGGFIRGTDTAYLDYLAGCVTFHAQHRHWHFDNFALFELMVKDADGNWLNAAASLKMTFCVADVNSRADLMSASDAQFSPGSRYFNQCSRSAVQGLSVGWGDNYPNGTSGQYIDITNTPDGTYCFVSTADPFNKLKESDDSDNVNSRWITLSTGANGGRTVAAGAVGCYP